MIALDYLGTGAAEGFPGVFCECPACTKARAAGGKNLKLRSCTLVNDHILIDLSPDIFPAALRWGKRLSNVDHIMVTHSHRDHLDLFSLFTRAKGGATILPGRPPETGQVRLFGNGTVVGLAKAELAEMSEKEQKRILCREISLWETVQVGELFFTALKAEHKKDEMCYIYSISDGNKHVLYGNDTGSLPEETFAAIEKAGIRFDVVSLDCARGTLPGDGHMGLKEDCQTRKRLMEIGAAGEETRFYLNHFSHMCGLTPEEFGELAAGEGFTLAWDGMRIEA